MPGFRARGALGGPCWPSSAQLPNKRVSGLFVRGLPHLTDTAGLPETFCLAYMPGFRARGALGGPCWPSFAQLPNQEVSEIFARGLPHLTNTAGLPETFCLACMPGFRARGALGGPG
eukprot:1142070-Pelagomonas_calceolata.AAC.1